MSPSNPKKRSQAQVVRDVNEAMNTNISHKTVSRMVREGIIGMSPMKRGPVGHLERHVWHATNCVGLVLSCWPFAVCRR